jgi:hypothetical protein
MIDELGLLDKTGVFGNCPGISLFCVYKALVGPPFAIAAEYVYG